MNVVQQSGPTEIVDAVLAREGERLAAMRANDADALEPLLADDLHYVFSSGAVQGKTEFIDVMRGGAGPQYGEDLDISDVEILAFPDNAVLLGILEMHIKGDPGFRGRNRFTMHWVRTDADWKLRSWQSTGLSDS